MARKGAMWKEIFGLPQKLRLACAVALLAAPHTGIAQSSMKNQAAGDVSGAIIIPPATDPGMVRQAPPSGDLQAVEPPPMPIEPDAVRKADPDKRARQIKEKPSAPASGNAPGGQATQQDAKPSPMRDDCKGAAELCKQDSAR